MIPFAPSMHTLNRKGNAAVSNAVAQEFIGHNSPEISRNYIYIETESLRKAADSMPDIFEK